MTASIRSQEEESTLVLTRAMIEDLMDKESSPMHDAPYVRVYGIGKEEEIVYLPLDKSKFSIGSQLHNDIVLTHSSLDNEQVNFFQEGIHYHVETAHKNVLLNGLAWNGRNLIHDGDTLSFGSLHMQFSDRGSTIMRELAALPIFAEKAEAKKEQSSPLKKQQNKPVSAPSFQTIFNVSDGVLIAFSAIIIISLIFGLFLLLEQS